MRALPLFVALGLSLVASGCGEQTASSSAKADPPTQAKAPEGPTNATLAGHYVGEAKTIEGKSTGDAANDMAAGMAAQLADGATLDLNEDGTFAMEMMLPYEGKFTLESKRLTLVTEVVAGVSKDDPQAKGLELHDMVFDVQEDGSLKVVPQEGAESVEMVFKRAEKKE